MTQAEWLRFDDFDAFAGQDAALLKTGDLDACKAFSRGIPRGTTGGTGEPPGNHRGNRRKKGEKLAIS